MVKVPPLGLLTTVLCAWCLVSATSARPLPPPGSGGPRSAARHHTSPLKASAAALGPAHHARALSGRSGPPPPPSPSAAAAAGPGFDDVEDDGSARSERSTNLSALYGPGRPMRMFINERHLQILPDGTVNGTFDDGDYTLLHRLSVNRQQVHIQSLATCLYLCMDSCGLLYGSEAATEECVFKEHFNTETKYTTFMSMRYSNERRIQYVALNKNGRPRKLIVKTGSSLGRLLKQMRVLPIAVEEWRISDLLRRKGHRHVPPASAAEPAPGAATHPLRHPGSYACPRVSGGPDAHHREEQDETGRDRARCRGRRKRGKKKRRCRKDEPESELCEKRPPTTEKETVVDGTTPARRKKKCLPSETDAGCMKRLRLERRRRKVRPGEDAEDVTTLKPKKAKQTKKKSTGKFVASEGVTPESAKRRGGKISTNGKDRKRPNQRESGKSVMSATKRGGKGGDPVTMTLASRGGDAESLETTSETPPPPSSSTESTTLSTVASTALSPPSPPLAATSSPRAATATVTKRSIPTLAVTTPWSSSTLSRIFSKTTDPGTSASPDEEAFSPVQTRSPTPLQGASLVVASASAERRRGDFVDEIFESSGAPAMALDY